jgi:cyclophilin family peptidyl-prolyl cis-trans isomerase
MVQILIALGGLLAVILGAAPPLPAPAGAEPNRSPVAVLHTSAGDITLTLRPDCAPATVARFIKNAQLGIYDGTIFHDVSPTFVYGGCFETAGSVKPITHVAPRVSAVESGSLSHTRGAVGIRAYNRPGCFVDSHEFYICMGSYPSWDGQLTLFAEVSGGLDILDRVAESAPGSDGKPALVVAIKLVEIRQ